jgi:hypothetical protein
MVRVVAEGVARLGDPPLPPEEPHSITQGRGRVQAPGRQPHDSLVRQQEEDGGA